MRVTFVFLLGLAIGLSAGCSPSDTPTPSGTPSPAEVPKREASSSADPIAQPATKQDFEEPTVTGPMMDEHTGIAVGQKAPPFDLKDQNGKGRSLDEFLAQGNVALVFYRSADW